MRLKRLEQWWRRLWIRALVRMMRRPSAGERPDWAARPHRVLFLRHDRAGDMILSTGVMRAIERDENVVAGMACGCSAQGDTPAVTQNATSRLSFTSGFLRLSSRYAPHPHTAGRA